MLKFNSISMLIILSFIYLNTSYVKVQFYLQIIRKGGYKNLNTSYVKVQLREIVIMFFVGKFKYILC